MGLVLITHDLRVAFSVARPRLRALRRLARRGQRCGRAPGRAAASVLARPAALGARRPSSSRRSCSRSTAPCPRPTTSPTECSFRRALPLGGTACASPAPPPLREVDPDRVLGLRPARGDPRRDARPCGARCRSRCSSRAARRRVGPVPRGRATSQGLRRRSAVAVVRALNGVDIAVGARRERRHRRRVRLGQDDARPLPRRARDADRRARSRSTAIDATTTRSSSSADRARLRRTVPDRLPGPVLVARPRPRPSAPRCARCSPSTSYPRIACEPAIDELLERVGLPLGYAEAPAGGALGRRAPARRDRAHARSRARS